MGRAEAGFAGRREEAWRLTLGGRRGQLGRRASDPLIEGDEGNLQRSRSVEEHGILSARVLAPRQFKRVLESRLPTVSLMEQPALSIV